MDDVEGCIDGCGWMWINMNGWLWTGGHGCVEDRWMDIHGSRMDW